MGLRVNQLIEDFLALNPRCPSHPRQASLSRQTPQGIECTGSPPHVFPVDRHRRHLDLTAQAANDFSGPLAEYDSDWMARHYVGLWSYAYAFLMNPDLLRQGWRVGRGETDSFYRVVLSVALQALAGRSPERIWDIGCGVGRTVHDLAGLFPHATIVGVDRSANMIEMAARVCSESADWMLDIEDSGFGTVYCDRTILPTRENTLFVVGDIVSLGPQPGEESDQLADLVLCVNVLDRSADPDALLASVLSLVAQGGHLLLTIAGSWRSSSHWRSYPDVQAFCLSRLRDRGFIIQLAIENVQLLEPTDARGAEERWPITVILAHRL